MKEILQKNIDNTPEYYHREYSNDIPLPSKNLSWSEQSNIERMQRVANVALPYLTLYAPLSYSISLGLGSLRAFSCLSHLIASIQEGNASSSAYQLLQTSIAAASLAGTIFAHPLGMLITTGQDLLVASGNLAMHLKDGEYKKATEDGLSVFNNAVYLGMCMHGGLELSITSLGIQVLTGLYHTQAEMREGRYLEAFGHAGMSGIRGKQLMQQFQIWQFHKKIEELTRLMERHKQEDVDKPSILKPNANSITFIEEKKEAHLENSLDELIAVCKKNPLQWPSLHWAIEKLHRPDVALAILARDPEEIHLLIPRYTTWCSSKQYGIENEYHGIQSALTLAIVNGYEDVAVALLNAGANPNQERIDKIQIGVRGHGQFSMTTISISQLGLALMERQNRVAKTLLEFGANPCSVVKEENALNYRCYSALQWTMFAFPNDRDLVKQIIDVRMQEHGLPSPITESDIDLVINYSRWLDPRYAAPLNNAVNHRDYQGVKRLLELGMFDFDSPQRDAYLDNMLYLWLVRANQPQVLDLLVEHGLDPKRIPVDLARKSGSTEIIDYLLEKGILIPD